MSMAVVAVGTEVVMGMVVMEVVAVMVGWEQKEGVEEQQITGSGLWEPSMLLFEHFSVGK